MFAHCFMLKSVKMEFMFFYICAVRIDSYTNIGAKVCVFISRTNSPKPANITDYKK